MLQRITQDCLSSESVRQFNAMDTSGNNNMEDVEQDEDEEVGKDDGLENEDEQFNYISF
ncbi:hypothetical protein BDR04DRAFT_1162746 [Suillus decipiens]|nr:hypothetical protein BDR04DRAFT_1162746 [Suillus decipiens]